ncbi:MAG TPA: septum formation initiator family protein [Candidatus Eisenbacteria bacterium]|nr:septum formation initiator family protein [Candidatus Eisenbacteria bacterium]
MMRSPYESPKQSPVRRFLRRRPDDRPSRARRRLVLLAGAAAGVFLAYSFLMSDTGLLKIAGLKNETETLRRQKVDLALRVNDVERRRQEQAKDPMLTERIARERFHLVKDGEILYRYKEPSGRDGR